ncbi:MAG: type II and III secretion system protein family protein [Parvibaculaceae bacterium]
MSRAKTFLGRAAAAAAIALGVLLAAAPATPLRATDASADHYDLDSGRFVRLGLGKSMVIRLPGAARDVLVGNPAVVEAVVRTQNVAYLFAKGPGQTNIFFFDEAGRQILNLDVEVSQDMKVLRKLLERTMPGTRVTVDTVGDNIVLGGQAANAAEAKTAFDLAVKFAGGDDKKVLSTVAITGKEQVMIRVRVAEMQREVLKALGVDWDEIAFKAGNLLVGAATSNPFSLGSGIISGGSGAVVNPIFQKGNTTIDGVLRVMERDGLLRTLAEPTLTAISGESAKFLAGGEFPVPVGQDNDTITIEFKPFGVGLNFTPVVLSEGRISLRVSTEVSELSPENAISVSQIAIPGLKVRRAETTLELPSGGSMVMAGLIQEQTKQAINGVPGLKDVPVLGALFRSRDFQSSRTELVVIVTPYVVNPVNEKQLATPIDRLEFATDRQTILFGRLHRIYGVAGDQPKGAYHGNVGYIVE